MDAQFEAGARPHVAALLPPDELERYQAEGAAMTLDQAVAFALDTPVEALADDARAVH